MQKRLLIYNKIFLLLFLITCSLSCEKDKCKNCYPTIFECKVDGKSWKTSCESQDIFGCSALDIQVYLKSKSIEIYAKNDNENSSMSLFLVKSINIGINKLYFGPNDIYTKFVDANKIHSCRVFKIDTLLTNFINITKLDTINQILQATFEFTGINDCGNKVKITDGKIDAIYRN